MLGQAMRALGPLRGAMLRGAMVGAGVLLAACQTDGLPPAGSPSGPDEAPRQTLGSALAQCTISHEYDPDEAAGLAPDALGEGEVEWRECAYGALDRALKPSLNEPAALDALIAEDRRLTGEIAAGNATRAERSAAIGARLDVMRTHEEVLRQEEISELSAGDLLAIMQSGEDAELDALMADLARVREAL